MCHEGTTWTEALPIILLGIRTAYKEDLRSSAAELVYGEPLRVPGALLVPTGSKMEPSIFLQLLRRHMEQLRPTPVTRHSSPTTFIHKDLQDSTHVFLRQDTIRHSLEPPYSGPHKVIARSDKTFHIIVRGRKIKVSTDCLKPAYLTEAPLRDNKHRLDQPLHTPTTPVTANLPPNTTRSGRTVRFPVHFAP